MSEQVDTNIDHPAHYNQGQIETIQVIEDAGLGQGFCLGNALKYLLRAPHKGSYLQDLKKASWYINRLIEKEEGAQ
jgi:hypothetical protein